MSNSMVRKAEQDATDQVEAKAGELHDAAWPNVDRRDRDRDVWETCLRIAAHMIERENR